MVTCEKAVTTPKSGLEVVGLGCKFERGMYVIEVVVDPKQRVTGLWIKPGRWRPAPTKTHSYQETIVEVGPMKLSGLLAVPAGDGPFPAVVLVHGSGPYDGDETIGPNRPFKDLSDGLAQKGIAVLRYEKRTHAPGVELPARLTVEEETVADARAAI
jgi:hypothetical protein